MVGKTLPSKYVRRAAFLHCLPVAASLWPLCGIPLLVHVLVPHTGTTVIGVYRNQRWISVFSSAGNIRMLIALPKCHLRGDFVAIRVLFNEISRAHEVAHRHLVVWYFTTCFFSKNIVTKLGPHHWDQNRMYASSVDVN